MRWGFRLAFLIFTGCGDSTADLPAAAQPLVGKWAVLVTDYYEMVELTNNRRFSHDYEFHELNPTVAYKRQHVEGTFTVNVQDSTMTLSPDKSSCADWPRAPEEIRYTVSETQMTWRSSNGEQIFGRDIFQHGDSSQTTFVCVNEAGALVPMPVVPLGI
ncbi:MAG TPA: hypothetical protein VGL59_06575 [Polyangia bacterium]|jgi:hypothetical protein